jgi:CRISPR-associated endonuclease Csn1
MSKTLGLDLGANSIGWAVVDTSTNELVNAGARVFPAGVNQYNTNKEEPKNATRRVARGLRRQYVRRRWRKIKLLEFLIEHGLTPFSNSDLDKWKKNRDQPEFEHIKSWFQLYPYELRSRGLSEKLSRYELGRALYHIIQRRGFLSNRKSEGDDADKEKSTLMTGSKETGATGILEAQRALNTYPTLGAYLNDLDTRKERIRNRYTERIMYVDEVKAILEAQKKYHEFIDEDFKGKLLGADTKKNMNGILFYQRALKSQKHTLGKCTFEPTKTRCPISSLDFEEFRVWQWVNSVEYLGQKLSQDDKEKAADFLLLAKQRKFSAIAKHLGHKIVDDRFNYKSDDTIVGGILHANFKKAFGTSVWEEMTYEKKHRFWHDVYAASDNDWLTNRLHEYNLKDADIKLILKTPIKRDYASLSRKAIRNILPFLRLGIPYHEAVLLGGVKNVFGEAWDTNPDQDTICDTILSFTASAQDGTLIKQIKRYLGEAYRLSDQLLEKLYHHSQLDHSSEKIEKLSEPQGIRNPIVKQSLYETKSLVNTLIDRYGKFDRISIELARDLKKSRDERSKITSENKKRADENERISRRLEQEGVPDTYDFRLRLKLFNELRDPKCCPYTGKQIHIGPSNGNSLSLFSGEVQIEHIIPYSRSLNNSFGNLTLCDANENRMKGNKTPFEYYSSLGKWEEVKDRAKDVLPYFKFKHFSRKDVEDEVPSRLLNDTRYLSREVHRYLKMICDDVTVVTGQLTAELRHLWGLNSLLDDSDVKNRDDHRHHAIDAIVVAVTNRSTINKMSRWNKFNKVEAERQVEPPWEDFRNQANFHINRILVSHKKVNRVVSERTVKIKKNGKEYRNLGRSARGTLHKEMVYGKRISPEDGIAAFHIRKGLESLNTVDYVKKVVDVKIREHMLSCLRQNGIDTNSNSSIPAGTFLLVDENGNRSSNINLVSHNGDVIPVFKTRVRENFKKPACLNESKNQFVDPQNNHHVAIYKDSDGNLFETIITFWDAVERRQLGIPVISKQDEKGRDLVTTLQANDMFLMGWIGDEDHIGDVSVTDLMPYLFRVQKLSKGDYSFRLHLAATLDKVTGTYYRITSFKAWRKLNPIKVWVTSDGRIEKFRH